jgi:hypothetical protein
MCRVRSECRNDLSARERGRVPGPPGQGRETSVFNPGFNTKSAMLLSSSSYKTILALPTKEFSQF